MRRAPSVARGAQLLGATALLLDPDELVCDGALWIEGGRVRRVLRGLRAIERCPLPAARKRMHQGLLAPGLVNAHAHLELGWMHGRVSGARGFAGWIAALLALRRGLEPEREAELQRQSVARGALRALETGTTAIGDIDSSGRAAAVLAQSALRGISYRELLDAGDPARSAAALAALDAPRLASRRLRRGISPHAPYTTSPALLQALRARARRSQLCVHLGETREEREWLEHAAGPFAKLLAHSPHRAGLELLAEAGLLGARTSFVHVNDVRDEELQRIAASGACVVHCPGTHAFFAREPFDWRRFERRAIPLALGSDSLASNSDLDLRREMRLASAAPAAPAPRRLFAHATLGGARALGLQGEIGALGPGHWADCALYALRAGSLSAALETLTSAVPEVRGLWVAGRAVAAPTLPLPAAAT